MELQYFKICVSKKSHNLYLISKRLDLTLKTFKSYPRTWSMLLTLIMAITLGKITVRTHNDEKWSNIANTVKHCETV